MTTELDIQIYCHNIRQDTTNLLPGEQPWRIRKTGICHSILAQCKLYPTIIGLQEVKHHQLTDIMAALGPEWTYFGVGRDDGGVQGEYSPILFNNTEWSLINGHTYWLSDTPDVPSKGWDAKLPRIVTFVTLQHRGHKRIQVFNTHYDHIGKTARVQSSLMIMRLMQQCSDTAVVCGDFNSEPHQEPYRTFVEWGMVDSAVGARRKRGFKFTDTGFKVKGTGFEPGREKSIDFIWTTQQVPIIEHHTLTSQYHQFLISDHRPVTAVLRI